MFGGNPEAAKIRNPVAATPESVAVGRRNFQLLCVRCHGPEGKGDGGGAGAGGQPADLTDAAWDFGATDGEIFTVLRDGTSADMESYAERLNESDAERWWRTHHPRADQKDGPARTDAGVFAATLVGAAADGDPG